MPRNSFRSFALIMSLLLLVPLSSAVQEGDESGGLKAKSRINGEYLNGLLDDFGVVGTSPVRWSGSDLLKLSAIFGGGLLLYTAEEDIQDWILDNKTETSENTSRFITKFGDGAVLLGFSASLYAVGEIFDQEDFRKTALLSLESYLASGVLVMGLKFIMGRARPKTGEPHSTFRPFTTKSGYLAMPSGHSASAFSVAAAIADQSGSKTVDVLVYSLATGVALSRLHLNKHWASDVLFGSALGYFVGKKISALNRGRGSKYLRIGLQVSPVRQRISLSFSF